jgi:hypothetical protein
MYSGGPCAAKYAFKFFATSALPLVFKGQKEMYKLYRVEITRPYLYPFADVGKYRISMDTVSLGFDGLSDLSLPTGIFLFSGLRDFVHVRHDSHTFRAALRAKEWQ